MPRLPGLRVGVGDVLDGGALRQVDGLGDRAGDERLDRAHHLDVAHVRDRALADGDVEDRQVLVGEAGRADDRAVLVEVRLDLLDLRLGVAERLQGERDGAVDDRHLPAADELLELDEREVGLDAGRVAVHQERDRPGRREHGGLGVAVAVALAELDGLVPRAPRGGEQLAVAAVGLGDRVGGVAVHAHHGVVRVAVLGVALVGAERAGDLGRAAVGATGHQRRDRRGGRRGRRRSRRACRRPSGRRRGWRSRGRAGGRRGR